MDIKEHKATHMANWKRFAQEQCRIEKTIYLAGMSGDGECFEDFTDAMCDDIRSRERIFGKTAKEIASIIGDNDPQAFLDLLFEQDKLGFLVQFATPVMQDGKSHSWGCYTTAWVYGETIEEAIENGFKWVAEQRQSEAKKSQSKKKSKIEALA